MNSVREVLISLIWACVPISIMGSAAFLIWKQVPGWGWYLFCAFMIVDSLKIKVS